MVVDGEMTPCASACSIMLAAIRSFTLHTIQSRPVSDDSLTESSTDERSQNVLLIVTEAGMGQLRQQFLSYPARPAESRISLRMLCFALRCIVKAETLFGSLGDMFASCPRKAFTNTCLMMYGVRSFEATCPQVGYRKLPSAERVPRSRSRLVP